jgi:hypothetical protein
MTTKNYKNKKKKNATSTDCSFKDWIKNVDFHIKSFTILNYFSISHS